MTTAAIEAVTTGAAPAPVGPYNQAVKAGGVLYCSGQIALDPATGAMVGGGDVEAETRQVLANLKAVLAALRLSVLPKAPMMPSLLLIPLCKGNLSSLNQPL